MILTFQQSWNEMIYGSVVLRLQHAAESPIGSVKIKHPDSTPSFWFSGLVWGMKVCIIFLFSFSVGVLFLTSCQVLLKLPVQGLHFEYHWCMGHPAWCWGMEGGGSDVKRRGVPYRRGRNGKVRVEKRNIVRQKQRPIDGSLFLIFKLVATWEWMLTSELCWAVSPAGREGPQATYKSLPSDLQSGLVGALGCVTILVDLVTCQQTVWKQSAGLHILNLDQANSGLSWSG